MPLPSLLTMDDPSYFFDHQMAHRLPLGAMSPLDRFSPLPYILDPYREGGWWRLLHSTAQDSFIEDLPSWPGSRGQEGWPNDGIGLASDQPLFAPDIFKPGHRKWFEFANFQEHRIAEASISFEELVYPFW